MRHELKIKPEYFAAIYFGEKTFEIRNNADRNFQVGDTLLLKAWDGEFTGDFVEKVVSYITDFEQKPGYVVLGLVNHREHELLEKFHRTGVAIERAISTGSVLADHPLKSRLDLLANHHKREQELADRCQLLAFLLRELRDGVEGEWCFPDELDERIDAAMAGKLPMPAMPEGWKLVEKANCFTLVSNGQVIASMAGPTAEGTAAILTSVLSGKLSALSVPEGWQLVPVEPTKEMVAVGCEDEGSRITDGAEFARALYADMLAAAPNPESTKSRTITEEQEFELTTVLQAIASGFSDDPAHDAVALLKRITGEVPWTGDSFHLPPRQGGELCATETPSSSPD